MAEESLNLSLDDIIKRNAENNKQKRSSSGVAKRGGRGGQGGRGGKRASSFQPRIQTKVITKTITRGRGSGRGSSTGRNVRTLGVQPPPTRCLWCGYVLPVLFNSLFAFGCRLRGIS